MIWTPDEEYEKNEQKYIKEKQNAEKEIKNCAKLIDEKLNEGKQYFLEALKKKNTIYANDVENYLKESGGKLGHNEFYPKNHPPQSGKIGDLQSQPLKDFGVWFHNDKLEHFSFRLKTKHLPKKFSLEISGSDYYGSFRAEYFSDKNKFSVNTGDPETLKDLWPFVGLLGPLAKKLNDELAKIPRYQDDPIPF